MIAVSFTQEQLKEAFEKVQNKEHWKNPIFASVAVEDLPLVMLAVEFYTATKVEIRQVLPGGKVLIYAKGYRLGPAGDH